MKDPALNLVHPAEILLKDFLKPLGISQYRLAKDVHVPFAEDQCNRHFSSIKPANAIRRSPSTRAYVSLVTPGIAIGAISSFIFQSNWSGTSFSWAFMACSQVICWPV